MWYEEIANNWGDWVTLILTAFLILKTIVENLPSKSLKNLFMSGNKITTESVTHGVNEMIKSGEIIYGEAQKLIKLVNEKDLQLENKDIQIANFINIITVLISTMNVPKDIKQNVYQILKQVDGVNDVLLQTLSKSIELQEQQVVEEIQLSQEIDDKLSGV